MYLKQEQRKLEQHLCLDKAYNSGTVEQELIKRGYVLHIPYKKKKGDNNKEKIRMISNRKKIDCKKTGCRRNKFMT